MIYWLIHWLVSGLALFLVAAILPGFKVKSYTSALFAAIVIGLASVIVRPILLFLTLPLNILTLGLFTFVVDAIVLKMCAALLKGFDIDTWTSAILGAVLLALIGSVLHYVLV